MGASGMIEFFTVLVLTYHIDGEPWETKVVYDTEDRCQEAMDRRVMVPLYDQLMDLYGKDIMMSCHTTSLVSKEGPRPRARPLLELSSNG